MCWICLRTAGRGCQKTAASGRYKDGKPTRQDKQHEPVHDQHGPEDGHVEDLEPAAQERDDDGAGGRVPELELGQAADEGAELLVALGRQRADGAVLHVVVESVVGRVELGLQEGQEQVEQVDAQGVGHCTPGQSVICWLGSGGGCAGWTDRCTSLAQRRRAGKRQRGRRRCRPSGRGRRASTGRGALGIAAGIMLVGGMYATAIWGPGVATHPLQLARLRCDAAERRRLLVWGVHLEDMGNAPG